MDESTGGEDTEYPQCSAKGWVTKHVGEADDEEKRDVFQVIKVSSVFKKQKKNTSLEYYILPT